jgi:RNA polymerase sigma-70 factor (ECF subfamily)
MQRNLPFSGDPKQSRPRSTGMLIDVASTCSGQKTMRQAAGLALTEQQSVTHRNTDTRAAWVGHIERIRSKQDQQAFVELFNYFAPRVKAFLMKSGADASLAEECTQEVMATLWHKAHLFDPSRASVATWIFTIARNRKIDVLRKQKRPEPEDLPWGPEAEPDQEDVLTLQQESEQLREAMAALPEAQKELIEKAYFGDFTQSEIAAQTGLPLGTIKSRIRLALDRLRHAMQ